GSAMVVVVMLCEMGLVVLLLFRKAMIGERADAEEADHVLQRFGLRRELFGSAGELFGASGVALGYKADLADGAVYLIHPGSLLTGCGGNFLNEVRRFLNRGDKLRQKAAGTLGDLDV